MTTRQNKKPTVTKEVWTYIVYSPDYRIDKKLKLHGSYTEYSDIRKAIRAMELLGFGSTMMINIHRTYSDKSESHSGPRIILEAT